MSQQEEGIHVGNIACIDCSSSDGMSLYEKDDGSFDAYCRAGCDERVRYKSNNKLAATELAGEYGIKKVSRKGRSTVKVDKEEVATPVKRRSKKVISVISANERDSIHDKSSAKSKGYRGIADKYNKHFGIRTGFSAESGEVTHRYYPCTNGKTSEGKTKLVGYKQRVCATKDFFSTGTVSKDCDMFGQWNCKGSGKYLIIVGGEEDASAAYQMLREDQIARNKDQYQAVDVVSPSTGETSAASQAKGQYEFFDGYENIIVAMDDDEAGRKAADALIEVLPMGKVRVMKQPCKDACEAIQKDLENLWVSAFYSSKKPKLAGVVAGEDMWEAVVDSVSRPMIPLPPMLKPLEDMLCGGLPYGEIINILAASGVGKTSITNGCELFWIFNAPYKCGILSLEAGAGKFLTRILSTYLKKNIARFKTIEEKVAFLESNKEKCFDLFSDEEGEDRFCLVDDKGDLDSLASAKAIIQKMIIQAGCEIIIIDPIQDLLDSLSVEEQAAFVGWQKKIKAMYNTTFINVNHTRKSGGGAKAGSQGGLLTEEDMQGTSALYKSAAVNVILTRDKTAEDPEERNTTKVTLFKSRDAGETGVAGYLFYDINTATLHDKDEWFKGRQA